MFKLDFEKAEEPEIILPTVRNAAGRKSHPYGPLIRAFYWAVALGQNSRGRVSKEAKGVCEV